MRIVHCHFGSEQSGHLKKSKRQKALVPEALELAVKEVFSPEAAQKQQKEVT